MHGPYAYIPTIWPPILTALFLLVLATYSWRRRHVPGATPFVVSCLFTATWAFAFALQYAAIPEATKAFWLRFGIMWSLPATTAVTCFILEYAWPGRWLTRRNLVLLSITPLLFALLLLNEAARPFLFRGYIVDGHRLFVQMNGWSWVFVAYAYLLGVINVCVLAWLFMRSPQQRWLVAVMIAGQIVSRIVHTQQIARLDHFDLPLDIPFLLLPYLVYAAALFAFHIFDPMAMARQMAIEQLNAGVLVLDRSQWVVGLNPAAARILSLSPDDTLGRAVGELLPEGAVGQPAGAGVAERVLRLGAPPGRDYLLESSPLRDWRGLDVGCLLLLYDVTEQRRAQTQLLEQQRVLATLQERERLARELHDSAGQMLGYVSLQAQAIQKHVHDGNLDAAESQLTRLAGVAAAAHTDVRESILSLRVGGASPCLVSALGSYLAAYEVNYGIVTELVVADGLSDEEFTSDTTVQLLRVIAEALTNARKHAHAGRVRVGLARDNGGARIEIADDGRGFATDAHPNGAAGHFGLAFMRERMAQVDGQLTIDSQPGAGTRIVLSVPLRTGQEVGE